MNQTLTVQLRVSTLVALAMGVGMGLALAWAAPALAGKDEDAVSGVPTSGKWQCYVNDRFPDLSAAASWRGAINMAEGLNQAAAHSPVGTVITASYPAAATGFGNAAGFTSVSCVKS